LQNTLPNSRVRPININAGSTFALISCEEKVVVKARRGSALKKKSTGIQDVRG